VWSTLCTEQRHKGDIACCSFRTGHKPQYGSSQYAKEERHNRLLHILGGTTPAPDWPRAVVSAPSSIALHASANVYVSESDPGTVISVPLSPGRQAYLVCIEGKRMPRVRAGSFQIETLAVMRQHL
jgi:hypothetical protein